MNPLRYNPEMLIRKPPSGLDVETTLAHFAIITYMVEPEALRPHVHERFELDCIPSPDGSQKALISVVPFVDRDFRFVRCPWPTWAFGQTNYRAYVTDSESGEHVAWFFGTSLASATVNIPRFVWRLPWHNAHIRFDTEYDSEQRPLHNLPDEHQQRLGASRAGTRGFGSATAGTGWFSGSRIRTGVVDTSFPWLLLSPGWDVGQLLDLARQVADDGGARHHGKLAIAAKTWAGGGW